MAVGIHSGSWQGCLPVGEGPAPAVVIGCRSCSCWCGERADPGRGPDCRAAARGSAAAPGCGAGIVHREDLWQLCRDELTDRVDVRADGWDIRGRWFGVVVAATPRTGELPPGQTIPWRVIAAQMAPRERRGSR